MNRLDPKRILAALIFLATVLPGAAAYEPVLTNGVKVLNDILFAVTDLAGPTNIYRDLEIEATNVMYYVVQNTGTNRPARPVLTPYSWPTKIPLVLELTDLEGRVVRRTPVGVTNALAPAREARIVFPGRVSAEPLTPRQRRKPKLIGEDIPTSFRLQVLGAIDDFFEVKKPGTYTLEARLRYWCYTNETYTWFLSDPVRVRVLVRDPKVEPRN